MKSTCQASRLKGVEACSFSHCRAPQAEGKAPPPQPALAWYSSLHSPPPSLLIHMVVRYAHCPCPSPAWPVGQAQSTVQAGGMLGKSKPALSSHPSSVP